MRSLSTRLQKANAAALIRFQPSRSFSCTSASSRSHADPSASPSPKLSPRWLSDLKAQAKSSNRQAEGARVLDYLGKHWLELLAGAEGYLTGPRWGLQNHKIHWGDMDSMGHVNNIIYNRFAESSRVNYFVNFSHTVGEEHSQAWVDIMTPKGTGLILKSIKTDYKFPLAYPDTITSLHKLLSRPDRSSTSIDMEAVIISHKEQRPAARCFEDITVYDYRIAKKATLPSFMVDELDKAYDAQEEVKAKALAKIQELQHSLE